MKQPRKVDYIVVGLGIAGIAICEQLQRHGKSFVVFDAGSGATAKSGGILNPTVLKRFTAVWKAQEFYEAAIPFYKKLSEKLNFTVFEETSILRIFKSVEEQNDWAVASDKNELKNFLSSEFIRNENPSINAPLGYGKVTGTGHISVEKLIGNYRKLLVSNENLISEKFEYDRLQQKERLHYDDFSADKIIFTEGIAATQNPFFPKHTLIENKGEYVIIKAENLKANQLLKGPLYVIPLGNDEYKVGATYSRNEGDSETTAAAREEIISKLKTFIKCDFEVIGQTAGIRPTTRDRRPLLGDISEYPNIFHLNGLGSRGFLMAPLLAEILIDYTENAKAVPTEIDINRFYKR